MTSGEPERGALRCKGRPGVESQQIFGVAIPGGS
jgi:hypothetical protein